MTTTEVRNGLEYFYDESGACTGFRPVEWAQPAPAVPKPVSRGLYRWECPDCGKHGRWYRNGNTADATGEVHRNKYRNGHVPNVVTDTGEILHSC